MSEYKDTVVDRTWRILSLISDIKLLLCNPKGVDVQVQCDLGKRKPETAEPEIPKKKTRIEEEKGRNKMGEPSGNKKEKINNAEQNVGSGDCVICMDKLGSKPLAATRCGHVFCQECLKSAFRRRRRCPICRCRLFKGKYAYPIYI